MMTSDKDFQLRSVLTMAHHDYEKSLKAFAFFKVHDRALGEDLVQAAFMKTWNYLVRGGKILIIKAFLFHVLNELIIDEYRKRKTSSLDAMLDKGFEPNAGDHEHLFDILDGKAAFLLIDDLDANYQKVIKMRYRQELSLEEMSFIMGKRKNTIAVQLHRGLAKLRLLYNYSPSSGI